MRLAITGTSGVGKTFLESLLHSNYGFINIPKYTDRPKRPSEVIGEGIYFIERNELQRDNHNYFFKLSYAKYIYGWKLADLRTYKKDNITIAITMESMQGLLSKKLDFIPILLYIDQTNLCLLEDRIKKQINYSDLSLENKEKADLTIKQRLNLARIETKNISKYIDIVEKARFGKAFKITDDNTLIKEVIPYILSLRSLN